MDVINYTLRINRADKQKAEEVFKNLGMTFSTGINIYLKTVGRERQIPFALNIATTDEESRPKKSKKEALAKFSANLKAMQEESKQNGVDNMSMEEIDEIIAEVRREKRGL